MTTFRVYIDKKWMGNLLYTQGIEQDLI